LGSGGAFTDTCCSPRAVKKKSRNYTVYFGGDLSSHKHLVGNAWLAEAIYEKSHGKFRCVLPQDFPLRGRSARAVRDYCFRALIACDLALFNFDGPEPESGTVVEFMLAKFADLPTVLVRSDVRRTGDSREEHWNLMTSGFPRTASVVVPSLSFYRARLQRRRIDDALRLAGQHGSAAAQLVCEQTAALCVRGLDRMLATEPMLPKYLREETYQWLARLPALHGKEKALRKEFEHYLEAKVEKDLL
ncbi:MAG TPA: nucleoside 2-deoxyribosyltransferase, partial [Opitutaceae bacterium]|nr:nucleoside 2-deoxyribosyltransferase [Opitutaceae bacterium]